MFSIIASSLIFEPPDWPTFLSAIAAIALVFEVVMLAMWCQQGGSATGELATTAAALFVGPLLAIGGMLMAVTSASMGTLRGTTAIIAGTRGTIVVSMAFLAWTWPTGGSIIAIGAVSILWAIRAYGSTTSPLSRRRKTLLLTLRIAAVLLVVFWALHPALQHSHLKEIPSVLVIGLDNSASMNRKDMPADYRVAPDAAPEASKTRTEALISALQDQETIFGAMAANGVKFRVFRFSGGVEKTSSARDWKAMLTATRGGITAIGDSAMAAMTPIMTTGDDVRGILLFSDGCNNTSLEISPEMFASRSARRKVPVYTIGVGADKATGTAKAISVRSVGAPDAAGAFRTMTISPEIDVIGLQGRSVKVSCTFGEEQVGTKTVDVTEARQRLLVEFTHVPLDAGFHKLTVRTEAIDENPEKIGGNHDRSKLVQVTDREMRILYIEGRFRYEAKYISMAIGTARRYTLHRMIMLQRLKRADSPVIGDSLEQWLRYHAIILGDVSRNHFTEKQLAIMKKLVVEYGKGLCMIGGKKSFGAGGWQNSPLNDIMPVDMARCTDDIDTLIKPVPTADGMDSVLMQTPSETIDIKTAWKSLNAMPGANLLDGVKPAASILAEANGRPMIVSQRAGKGRTLAIAFDTTWRWVMSPPPENPSETIDGAEMQRRFWRQVANYLAAPRGNVWIHTDRITYDLAKIKQGKQKIAITSGVEDASGSPAPDIVPAITITTPDGKTSPVTIRKDRDNMRYRGFLQRPSVPGVYTLNAKAVVGGKSLSAKQVFQVTHRDLESREVLADFGALRGVALAGEGEFTPLCNFGTLMQKLEKDIEPRVKEIFSTEDILASWRWPLILLLIALVSTEWFFRKKFGLI